MERTHACHITVKFQVPGFHRWPDAPEHRAYLRNDHRHLFHVEVSTPVEHHERQIELHDLMDEAKELFCQPTNWASCESMAYHLATRLSDKHQGAPFRVAVFEDGEAGATVELR
ncbi:hypothetical protein [Bradyrhizobium neotropicale]|uniref:hypothetical protein n=1 Tax=Bradyrhizobium neotropicale TaxID=1497615 RepID=UPI001AD61DAB|nr:hypothetical protein [Bradyrhizobium neotropicale]MBO4221981.1 hypothetical protein [Bradyrhizobium neotropicale]